MHFPLTTNRMKSPWNPQLFLVIDDIPVKYNSLNISAHSQVKDNIIPIGDVKVSDASKKLSGWIILQWVLLIFTSVRIKCILDNAKEVNILRFFILFLANAILTLKKLSILFHSCIYQILIILSQQNIPKIIRQQNYR
jgi:hypothetical protein